MYYFLIQKHTMMYKLYNLINQQSKSIPKKEIQKYLEYLEDRGAVFSLDLNKDINYNFEEDSFQSEDITFLIKNAKIH